MRYAMIMAGGAGTRLWPMSRKERPKQLLPLIEESAGSREPPRSLLRIAADRVEGLVPTERRYICTGEQYRAAIRSALPGFTDDRILGEPAARDTVNAVGFAAAVFMKQDPDAVFIVLTADHLIEPQDVFRARVDLGFRLVEQDPKRLVTFSIKPTHPATGFGYVERGAPIHNIAGGAGLAFKVARFVEKPDLHRAQAYVESGAFAWNSGMFVFHAGTVMECLRRFKPESHAGLSRIADAWGTESQSSVLNEVYPTLPKISVDYAVMEPASRDEAFSICTVLTDVRWLDVGSWPSYAETLTPDTLGNKSGAGIRAVVEGGKGNLIVGEDRAHTVALLGVDNLIVVHTDDATLVMSRDSAEQLKKLHERLPDSLR